MKEFYLIPKHQFQLMNSHKPTPTPSSGQVNLSPPTKPRHCKKSPEIGEQWMTRVIPPPLQKGIKMKGIRPFKYDGDSNHIRKNPNILQELSTELQGKNLIRGKLLLKYIENSGQLEWDELGDIYRPMSGYNIIQFISNIVNGTSLDDDQMDPYKLLILSSNIPFHHIKNQKLRNYTMNVKKPKKKKSGRHHVGSGAPSINKNALSWMSY